MNFAWFMTFQQYCNRTGTLIVFSCIIQYSENITAARFSLRFLPPPGTGTWRGPEQFTMWCSFLGCTSFILSSRQHHCTMVTPVNRRHVAPPGEKLASLFSSLVNEAFRNQTKCWKKYGVLSKATSWGDITWRYLCMFLVFFSKNSCSSQGPVMQACFRPWTACHDGVHPLWKQTMLSINVNQCAGFYRQPPSSKWLFHYVA